MTKDEIWARRVAEWKASGLTSPEFCRDKPFTPGGLRYMAFQLKHGKAKVRASVRLARVVRVAPREPGAAAPGVGVVIELGGARVAVPPGVDRLTLATVIDVLAAAGSEA